MKRFSIGVGAEPNPLMEDLHISVHNQSLELYAKHIHFLIEPIHVYTRLENKCLVHEFFIDHIQRSPLESIIETNRTQFPFVRFNCLKYLSYNLTQIDTRYTYTHKHITVHMNILSIHILKKYIQYIYVNCNRSKQTGQSTTEEFTPTVTKFFIVTGRRILTLLYIFRLIFILTFTFIYFQTPSYSFLFLSNDPLINFIFPLIILFSFLRSSSVISYSYGFYPVKNWITTLQRLS